MSLLHAALSMGRKRTESRFTETVTVGRFKDGTDATTGDPTRVPDGDPSYEGPAQVKYPSLTVTDRDAASQPVGVQTPVLKLPSGTVIPVGDEVKVEASTVDASLVGRTYEVDGYPQAGQTTSARYPLKELS